MLPEIVLPLMAVGYILLGLAIIVLNIGHVPHAIALIVQSAFVSAGQRCSCARRLIVEAGAAGDRIVEALTALVDRLRVGAPFDDPQPFLGPVIDNPAAHALLGAQARLEANGGRILRALGRFRADRPLLGPGLIDVTGLAVPDEEHFGPLLQVIRAETFDKALAAASNTRFGLAAGLIGGDEALYRRFWRGVRAGVVNWNRPTTGAASASPFGGVGDSGNHRASAFYAADYCAYPVAGLETETTAFRIGTGLSAE